MGKEHSLAETRPLLAAEFKLSAADQDELLPSGRQSRFTNRVAWAKVYLQQAGLLLSPRRCHFQIPTAGSKFSKVPPARIHIESSLSSIPTSRSSAGCRVHGEGLAQAATEAELKTPEEALEAAHQKMKGSLASEASGRAKAEAYPRSLSEWVVRTPAQRWATAARATTLVRPSASPVTKV